MNEIYSKHTDKSVDEIKSALERDNFMTADSAKSFGLIDEVVEKRSWNTIYWHNHNRNLISTSHL